MFNTELLISVPQTHSSSNVCSSGNDTSIHLVACSVQNPLCHSWFVSSHTQLPIHQQILLELLWNYIVNQSSSHYLHCCCPSRGTIISCLDNCSRSKLASLLACLPSCCLFSLQELEWSFYFINQIMLINSPKIFHLSKIPIMVSQLWMLGNKLAPNTVVYNNHIMLMDSLGHFGQDIACACFSFWGFSWEDVMAGSWNHLKAYSVMCLTW